MIPRILEKVVYKSLFESNKIQIIYGPRQSGKTTLLKNLEVVLKKQGKLLFLNCDLEEDINLLNTTSLTKLKSLTQNYSFLFIDEAQRLDNPGLTLKIIHDQIADLRVLATGSSSFKLKNQLSDSLTGRYIDYNLYPLSFYEALGSINSNRNKEILKQCTDQMLDSILLYGLYPDVFLENIPQNKERILERIVQSYLFSDILEFGKVKYSEFIYNLAKAVAYQVGSEVNENELSKRLKIDRKTVVRYLDLMEKSFVIIKVYPYSKNPRREIGKNYKIYFTDLGLRNALIGDFNSLNLRTDRSALWENFLIIERIKKYANNNKVLRYNFWRTFGGAEVDWIEDRVNEGILGYELKMNSKNLSKGAGNFKKDYKTEVELINSKNYTDFIF